MILQSVTAAIVLSGQPPGANLMVKALIIIAILMIQSPGVRHALYLLGASAGDRRAALPKAALEESRP
jgi:hypothetical protein